MDNEEKRLEERVRTFNMLNADPGITPEEAARMFEAVAASKPELIREILET